MSSTPKSNAKAGQEGYESPLPLGKEESECGFAKYGLSPPKNGRTFIECEKRIKKEYKWKWESGTADEKNIILFLYSRSFHGKSSPAIRKYFVNQMLKGGEVRDRMLQVINADGDKDRSEEGQLQYIQTCLTLDCDSKAMEIVSQMKIQMRSRKNVWKSEKKIITDSMLWSFSGLVMWTEKGFGSCRTRGQPCQSSK